MYSTSKILFVVFGDIDDDCARDMPLVLPLLPDALLFFIILLDCGMYKEEEEGA